MNLAININQDAWQLQTAKAQFSELFRRARTEGPQYITRRGTEAVVMLAAEDFEHLVARSSEPKTLVEFFRQSPLAGVDLEIERDMDPGRDIDF